MTIPETYLKRLIEKAYVPNQGFRLTYTFHKPSQDTRINNNDLGDYLPFLHYFGYYDICQQLIETCLHRYPLLCRENYLRYGSTKLIKYGVTDLYSNSDYFHGLLFALKQPEYSSFHETISFRLHSFANLLKSTRNTHFVNVLGREFSIPIRRPIDAGMMPELLHDMGFKDIALQYIDKWKNSLLCTEKALGTSYIFNYNVGDHPRLMKDHTNFLFSCIALYNPDGHGITAKDLKKLISIVYKYFARNSVVYNTRKDLQRCKSSSLAFSFLEVLLDAYAKTCDEYYLAILKDTLPFWLRAIEKHKVLPDYIDVSTNKASQYSPVDNNTDFYVFMKKLRLLTNDSLVSEEFHQQYRRNIVATFVYPETQDIASTYCLHTKSAKKLMKSKFTALFMKIWIADNIRSVDEYYAYKDYLDDR